EPPILELQQHRDAEAVVERGASDVAGTKTGPAVECRGDRPRRQGGDALARQDGKLDARLWPGAASLSDGTEEGGWFWAVADTRSRGHDDRAGAVGLEAEVEQAKGPGDHPGPQVVVHGQRPAEHLGGRVGIGPGPADERDMSEVLLGRAVLEHMALGHDGEYLPWRE